jgi:hypothetical protein
MSWRTRLAELKLLVQPPDSPYGAPVDWVAFERENGFLPPPDYRALLDRYGAGTLQAGLDGLVLLQPMHPMRSFLDGNRWIRDNLRGLQRLDPTGVPPWPIYPEPGGFLPFAVDESSWTVGWLTQGAPEDWTTCIDGGRDGWWDELPVGAAELVMRWARGDLGIPDVERAAPGGTFLPYTQDEYWSGFTATANVEFGRSPGSATLPQRDHEWVKEMVAPAHLQSFGASGDARIPLHGKVGVAYRPEDEPQVIAALQALATDLGTSIVAATSLDGSPIWPDVVAIDSGPDPAR